jgi:hypothetical protein
MVNQNQQVVNVIRQAIEQDTAGAAKMTLNPGVVDTASGYLCSAYIQEDNLVEEINVPAGMYVTAGAYIMVGQLDNTAWIDRLIPQEDYTELAFDYDAGKVYAGTGTAEPSHILSVDQSALWPASSTFNLGAASVPFNEIRTTTVDGGDGHLYLSAPDGYQVWVGTQNGTDYVRLGHATSGAGSILPGTYSNVDLGNSAWPWNAMVAEYITAQGDSSEGQVNIRRHPTTTSSTWQNQGVLTAEAHNGTALTTIARIAFTTEGTVSGSAVPGRLGFWIQNDSGTLTQYYHMTSDGHFYPTNDEAQRIGWQNGGSFVQVVSRNIYPANSGTPDTNSSIGKAGSVWHHLFVENIKSSGDIHFYPDGSTSYDVLVSNDGIKPRVDGAMDLGTNTERFGTIYADEVITASPYTWLYTTNDSPATWTKPTNLAYLMVECVGAGGGGGGNASTGSNEGAGAGGGGGGGYSRCFYAAADLPSSCTATVGSGGTGGSGNNNGSDGGNSTFSGTGITSLVANGGGGGDTGGAGSGNAWVDGGGTSVGSGPDGALLALGSPGTNGQRLSITGVSGATGVIGGGVGGASAAFGGSGRQNTSTGAGYSGNAYGGGGAGAISHHSESSKSGGSGANGLIIVTEFYA